jgi:carboxypeptidase family protein/TonB-dependent receptor-like protein
MHMLRYRQMTLPLLVALMLPGLLGAQSATTALSGRVVDSNGGLIPQAVITVTDEIRSVRREVTTGSEGFFVVDQLPPSSYTVRVEKNGFGAVEFQNVTLNVTEERSLGDIRLRPPEPGQTLTVNVAAPLIVDSATVSTVVDRRFMENQPVSGRSFQRLIELSPGVTMTPWNLTTQGQFSANGQRANSNYFTVDGVSANFASLASTSLYETAGGAVPSFSASGTTTSLASVDAVQEFSIQTSTYAPEFGRQPGAQVSIVTRAGTDVLHGNVFNYLRNSVFEANNFFANRNGLSKPAIRQNDFGFVLGGPMPFSGLRDGLRRTFFFASYEGVRLRQPVVTDPLQVPTIAARNAASGVLKDILNSFPLPTDPEIAGSPGAAGYIASFSNPQSVDAGSLRIDHTLNSRTTIFGRYNYAPSEDRQRARFCAASCVALLQYRTQTATSGVTMQILPFLSNDLRLNWSEAKVKQSYYMDNFGGAIPAPFSSLYPAFTTRDQGYVFIEVSSSGNNTISDGLFSDDRQRHWNLVDVLTYTRGAHAWKWGIDYRRLASATYSGSYKRQFRPDSIPALVANTPAAATIIAPTATLRPIYNNFSTFAQDAWRVNGRLTLTYGVRYEVNPAPSEKKGNLPFTVRNLDNPTTLDLEPQGTRLYKTTFGNFAPRIGVAYQLLPQKRLVVRSGVGVFYDLGYNFSGSAFSTEIFPFAATQTFSAVTFTSPQFAAVPPAVTIAPPYPRVYAYTSDFKLPYTVEYNLTLEQGIGNRDTVSIGYVGATGRRLGRVESLRNVNSRFSRLDVVRDNATSDYNSLQIQYRHPLSHDLQVLGSYTLAKSLDTVSDESQINFQAPAPRYSPNTDRGPSTFDTRHSFSAAASYSIPFRGTNAFARALLSNYGLDARVRAVSSRPVNVITGRDPFGLGITTIARPDLVAGQPLYLNDSSAPGGKRFNPAAFDGATPLAAGRQGTLGRNVMRGFGASQVDLSARREFHLVEDWKLQARVDAFNIFNHPNFNNPPGNLRDANFGQSTQMLASGLGGLSALYQVGGPRSLEIALKILF